MNTNSNSYTLVYASVMVIIVAFLLAFVASSLRPIQDRNVELDKKKQILAALNMRNIPDTDVERTYSKVVQADMIIKADGTVVNEGKDGDKAGFKVSGKDVASDNMPVYKCNVKGETIYVIPMTGRGLWGGLWGYVAVRNNNNPTVYGAYFSHESETAGLGAIIAETTFQDKFIGKSLYADSLSKEVALTVVKSGKVEADKQHYQVDGVTGATLTTNGVAEMVTKGLQDYAKFLQLNRKQ